VREPKAVPFDAFLDLLRAKGYGISLHEYTALAALLQQWDRTHVSEFGDAVAALVGRSTEEVDGIRRLFDEVYLPPPPPRLPIPPVHEVPIPFWRSRVWSLALIGAAALLLSIGLRLFQAGPTPPAEAPPVVPPIVAPSFDDAVAIPPPPPPALPPAPQRIESSLAVETLAGSFLAVLALFWAMKIRERKRAWLREAWSTVRGALPGPYHYKEIVRDQPARLPRSDVDDAATLLGRVFNRIGQARELDVPRSLRATLRQGLLPVLITKPRRIAETVFVAQDVCQEMRLWEPKVDAFLTDLRRQGIVLQRVYFDGDLSRVSDRPHRQAVPFELFLRDRANVPVLIVSSGSGIAAALADRDQPWLRQLRDRGRTAWLTPVSDMRLWPRAFADLPIDVWPMTRQGLLGAARQLAGLGADTTPEARARLATEGRVTLEDIERLKRLASLVPHPTPGLLNLLRQRYAPDVPDAALLHLMLQAEGPAAPVVRLADEDVRRHQNDVRRENPDLEVSVRETVLAVLKDSEPLQGSAAHERWRIAVAVQRILLGDVAPSSADIGGGVATLRSLAKGPMWREVQDALKLAPDKSVAVGQATALATEVGDGPEPSAGDERLALAGRMPWSWPGLRELVPAALTAALLLLGALSLNALPLREVGHIQDAYSLSYAPTPSASTPQLTLDRLVQDDTIPQQVDLYRQDQLFRAGLSLANGANVVQLTAADTGSYFQVRATLPENNLAVSQAVWVASDRLSFVVINASPWANVTITDGTMTTAAQQTPFTAALMPGSYQLRFENPNLNPPSTLEQSITVTDTNSSVQVTMPNFDRESVVDDLLKGQ
jgi:hypothetical protein